MLIVIDYQILYVMKLDTTSGTECAFLCKGNIKIKAFTSKGRQYILLSLEPLFIEINGKYVQLHFKDNNVVCVGDIDEK